MLRAVERNGGWILPLGGFSVNACSVEARGFVLHLVEGDHSVHVSLACSFRLRLAGGEEVELDPEIRRALGPALVLVEKDVDAAEVDDAGHLRMRFADGAEISIGPSDEYEAWEVAAETATFLVVSAVGGEVAVWA